MDSLMNDVIREGLEQLQDRESKPPEDRSALRDDRLDMACMQTIGQNRTSPLMNHLRPAPPRSTFATESCCSIKDRSSTSLKRHLRVVQQEAQSTVDEQVRIQRQKSSKEAIRARPALTVRPPSCTLRGPSPCLRRGTRSSIAAQQ